MLSVSEFGRLRPLFSMRTALGEPRKSRPLRRPKFDAIPAAILPLCVEKGVIGIKHALPGPEDVACLASNGVTHEFAAAPELVSELRYPRSAGIVHPQLGSRRPYGGFRAFSSVVRQVPPGPFSLHGAFWMMSLF